MAQSQKIEFSEAMQSDLFYLPEPKILLSKPAIGGTGSTHRFQRLIASQYTNKNNIYSRLLSMMGTGPCGQNIRDAFIAYTRNNPDADDKSILQNLAVARMESEKKNKCTLEDRGDKRAIQIYNWLDQAILTNLVDTNYVDFGGNLWHNAQAIANALDLGQINIVDILPPRGELPKEIKYFQITDSLPFEADSIGLITALMVLHHIKDPAPTIAEFFRVLKPGGIVIVREHDIRQTFSDADDTSELIDLIDTLHLMHHSVWQSETDFCCEEYGPDLGTYYLSFNVWTAMFINAGFSPLCDPLLEVNFRKNWYNSGYLAFLKI